MIEPYLIESGDTCSTICRAALVSSQRRALLCEWLRRAGRTVARPHSRQRQARSDRGQAASWRWLSAVGLRQRCPAWTRTTQGYPLVDQQEVATVDDEDASRELYRLASPAGLGGGRKQGRCRRRRVAVVRGSSAGRTGPQLRTAVGREGQTHTCDHPDGEDRHEDRPRFHVADSDQVAVLMSSRR